MKTRKRKTRLVLLLLVLAAHRFFLAGLVSQTVDIEPGEDVNFVAASFNLSLPEGVEKPRYILVLLPGFNGDGERLLYQSIWRAFAKETNAAMLACTFRAMPYETEEEKENYVHYAAARWGSGAALERAIEEFDKKSPSMFLEHLPLLIYGHSAGGQFAYGFSCYRPSRMIGFAAGKGGYYFPFPIEGTYEVPGLMISGEMDLQRRRTEIRKLFEDHRKHGVPWCWLEDDQGHGVANTWEVVTAYFRDLLKLRLPAEGNSLRKLSGKKGVWVDLESKQLIAEGESGKEVQKKTRMGYLPSKSVYELWSKQDIGARKYVERVEGIIEEED